MTLEWQASMAVIREFESRLAGYAAEGLIDGSAHPSVGMEAVAVGICSRSRDRRHHRLDPPRPRPLRSPRAPTGRDDGRALRARRPACCHGKGGSMHIADFSVGMLGANGIVGRGLRDRNRRRARRSRARRPTASRSLLRRQRRQPGLVPRGANLRRSIGCCRASMSARTTASRCRCRSRAVDRARADRRPGAGVRVPRRVDVDGMDVVATVRGGRERGRARRRGGRRPDAGGGRRLPVPRAHVGDPRTTGRTRRGAALAGARPDRRVPRPLVRAGLLSEAGADAIEAAGARSKRPS